MQDTRVAARYAKSLIDLAQEKNVLEEVKKDMGFILDISRKHKDFVRALKSPIIKTDKKISILEEVFNGQLNMLSMEFIRFVAQRKRESYIPAIAEEFINQYKEIKNIKTAVVTTAVQLDDTLRKKIKELVKADSRSEVELVEKVDKDIIGGFILKVGDKQLDESVAGKLNDLKRRFSDNPYIKEY